MKATAVIQLQK